MKEPGDNWHHRPHPTPCTSPKRGGSDTTNLVSRADPGRGSGRGREPPNARLAEMGLVSPYFFCADGHSPHCPDAEDLDTPLSWWGLLGLGPAFKAGARAEKGRAWAWGSVPFQVISDCVETFLLACVPSRPDIQNLSSEVFSLLLHPSPDMDFILSPPAPLHS